MYNELFQVYCIKPEERIHLLIVYRAYPGSEFVVANTLPKWKKLEPNKRNFSQGLSQKVISTSCFVFNSLPARGEFCGLLITFANSLDPDVGSNLDPNCLTPGWC